LETVLILRVYNRDFSSACFNVGIRNESAAIKIVLDHVNGTSYYGPTIVAGTYYRVEVKWDNTGDTWAWKLDGTPMNNGALVADASVGFIRLGYRVSERTGTVYFDNIAIDDADWVGEEAAGGGGGTQDIYLRPGHATPEDIILRDPTLADGPGGVALDGIIAATSTLTASLSLTVPLDGSMAAVSALSASLSLTVPLAGSIAGTSTLSAELTVVPAGVNLDGVIAATSILSAELSISKPLDGILAGVGALSAILSLTKPLAGAIDASSTLSAALSLTVPLAGVIAGASTLSAELSLGKLLAGTTAGTSTLSASLSLTKTLDGAIVATSVLSGVLSLTVPLSGILDGVSTLSGELTVIGFGVNLDGVISAISTLTATLTVEMAVFGRLRLVTPAQPYLPILCRALTHHVLPTTAEAGKTIYTEAAMELHLTCPPIGGHSWS
jgi:hypothetical protein